MNASNTRDYYNYTDELFKRLVSSHDITKPYQIEFQPGINCDLYRCHYCYGFSQVQMPGLIGPETYIKVLDEIEGTAKLVQLSGISTEPTTNPYILEIVKAIKERKFICGLHTKGYRLNSELIEILTDDMHELESYVTVSLDASNSDDYVEIHNLGQGRQDKLNNTYTDYFSTVISNIKKLHESRVKKSSTLRINIAYLLFKQNFSEGKVEDTLKLIGSYCDVIRFSIPQARNDGTSPSSFIDAQMAKEIIDELKMKYKDNKKVRVLEKSVDYIAHETSFKYCYAQMFQAVIDKAGNVFPCPQTSLKDYKWLAYGNVKESSLFDILGSVVRKKLLSADIDKSMKCRVCDRKDEAINLELSGIFKDQNPELIIRNL